VNAFESVIALILRRQGYWIQQSVKVELTKEEKRTIGRHSSPRWEIDLVGFRPKGNEVLAVECKSFLDSPGVQFREGGFLPPERYKLFSEPTTRQVVLNRLAMQLTESGHCLPQPKVILCLAVGKMWKGGDQSGMEAHFRQQGWWLFDPTMIVENLRKCIDSDYEDDVAFVVAKLIGRVPA